MVDDRDGDRAHRLATLRDRLDRGVDRRQFLRTLLNAGYTVGLASVLGVDDFLAADDGYVPIVTALVRDAFDDSSALDEQTTYVPAEWYAAITKAFEAHALVAKTSIPGYLASAVEPGAHYSPAAAISVGVSASDVDGANAKLETLLDEVQFSVDAIEGVDDIEIDDAPGDPRLLESTDGDVPGGVACQAPGPSTSSLMPALYHPDADRPFFATAHHTYDDADDPIGEPLYLPLESGDRPRIGRVRYDLPVEDVVAVEPDDEFRPASRIHGSDPETVLGQYTRLGLADLAARDEPLEKVGAMTGHSAGTIVGIDAITCLTDDFCRRGQLKWGDEDGFTDGDSGSVSYHPATGPREGVLVASVNNARTWWPGQNYIWGVAAYHLTNEHGYHF